MSRFISVENMRSVLDGVTRIVRDSGPEVGQLVRSNRPPLRQVVYDVMVDMAQDDAFSELSVPELNRVASDSVAAFYERLLEQQQAAVTFQRSTDPDLDTDRSEPGPVAPFNVVSQNPQVKPQVGIPLFDSAPASPVIRCVSIDGQHRNSPGGNVVSENGLDAPRMADRWQQDRYQFTYTLAEPIRSVMSAETSCVILPEVHHAINCTHLLLVIEELPSAYSFNSPDPVRRAFSKLIIKSQYAGHRGGGRSYTVLEPAAKDIREFDPPIPSLSRLSVRLTRPDGCLVSASKDDWRVVGISSAADVDKPTFTLKLDRAFEPDDFQVNDIIVLFDARTGNSELDSYLNDPSGHVLTTHTRDDHGVLSLVIRSTGHRDETTGEWLYSKPVHDFIQTLPMDDPRECHSLVDKAGNPTPLPIMNLSVQMSVTLEAKCAHSGISDA